MYELTFIMKGHISISLLDFGDLVDFRFYLICSGCL